MNIQQLKSWADKYETLDFIKRDPIQIPHNYKNKNDIEISAFVTSWITYGKREHIIKKAEYINNNIFNNNPYQYIINKSQPWNKYKDSPETLYRFYKYSDFYSLCKCLHYVYSHFNDMEEALLSKSNMPIVGLHHFFGSVNGIPNEESKSACKRLCMFLRWMCRINSPVDLGIWTKFSTKNLIIPLDTHVFRIAKKEGLTKRNTADMTTALEITEKLKQVFPNDPVKGDFALFGYGEDNNTI